MTHTTLIDTATLASHLGDPDWAVVDCRYSLENPDRGELSYLAGHIPAAVYAHIDRDLSGPVVPGRAGRHPLPDVGSVEESFGAWGIGPGAQVVAYDDAGGAMAARLWWLARWLGHEAVAVLDGGWPRWQAEGRPTTRGLETRPPRPFTPELRPELVVGADEVDRQQADPSRLLLDARAADRFRGENETIDPVAGHIPGAVSAPYADNLAPDGRFLEPDQLRARFEALLGEVPPEHTTVYCGSGVTAAHNLLAMAHAGLGEARLYAGSWSDWITDPERAVSMGT